MEGQSAIRAARAGQWESDSETGSDDHHGLSKCFFKKGGLEVSLGG